nr:PREDICTED: receptor-type tyrosine-protein phosphatase N2 [Latimeria chalumnae]|eukprot:XP_014351167.1 PREDICTED: receptor-type tyrosine-protein phosphatase N2 [Latimeria chalumnae]
MMELLYSILFVLSAFHNRLLVFADRKFGCLFEDDLCKHFEICINDGLFGRCQRVPVIDVYRYEVSPPILQHLRTILQKLSHRGTTSFGDSVGISIISVCIGSQCTPQIDSKTIATAGFSEVVHDNLEVILSLGYRCTISEEKVSH